MCAILLHGCLHVVLSTKQSLQDHIVNARPQQIHVDTYLLEMLAECTKRPFVAEIILFGVLVLNELFILLVDGVVGQVHVLVVLVYFLSVGFTCETGEAFLEDVNFHGFVAGHQHVDTQIELVAVDQQRVGDVLADDTRLVHVHIVDVIDEVDTAALARIGRLHNPDILFGLVLFQFLIMVVKVTELIRKDVSVG